MTGHYGISSREIDDALTAVAESHPIDEQAPSSVRRRLTAYRSTVAGFFHTVETLHAGGAGGQDVCRALTHVVDRIVLHGLGATGACCDGVDGLAAVAIGGYGREEMNPRSDVDLLFVAAGDAQGMFEGPVAAFVQFMWDLNLDLGHSTRTVEECLAAAAEDTDFATSLLESRLIAGDYAVYGKLESRYREMLNGSSGDGLIMRKLEERDRRYARFGGTVQVQEPDIKESPGGLRDIHLVRWLEAIRHDSGGLADHQFSHVLTTIETRDLDGDFDFLLRMRNGLHFLTGKKQDLLNHMILPDLADALSDGGTVTVEQLMHDYYMRAARISRLTGRAVDRLTGADSGNGRDIATIPDMRIGTRDVSLTGDAAAVLNARPEAAVKLFAVAGAQNLRLAHDTAQAVERWIATTDIDIPAHKNVRAAFQKLLSIPGGVGKTFRIMHAHGFLSVLIPEFSDVAWHYQYDFYHTFTTDEHSIRVVENIEAMLAGTSPAMELVADIAPRVTARQALFLAGLLHDVGKKKGRGHASRGEIMAGRALRRLGCDRRTIELVRFLIREHLLMSHISQRRDIDDVDTISDFVERTGSTGRLRMLMLLTVADLQALAPGALTEWKKALLRSLYDRALAIIEKGFERHVTASRTAMIDETVAALAGTLPAGRVRRHLELLPEQYLRVTRRSSVKRHVNGIERLDTRGVWASFSHRDDVTYLTVITRDYQRALSDICGTITASGINIVGARIFTRNDGIIIDTFLVVDGSGQPVIPADTQREFKHNIRRVLSGETTVSELLDRFRARWRRRRRKAVPAPPRVRIDNEISSRYTVVDVFATDYTGLLYDITSVFAAENIDIHTARIGTDEDQVADAFYIRRRDDGKVTDDATLDRLSDALIATLYQVE